MYEYTKTRETVRKRNSRKDRVYLSKQRIALKYFIRILSLPAVYILLNCEYSFVNCTLCTALLFFALYDTIWK